MADGTNLSINLKVDDLVDGLDKSAAKFDTFAAQAQKSIDEIDKKTSQFSTTQIRAYEVVKKSTQNHIQAMQELSSEYESLRSKQKSGISLTQEESARLQALSAQFKNHVGAIRTNNNALNDFVRQQNNVVTAVEDTQKSVGMLSTSIKNAFAINIAGIISYVEELALKILHTGVATQQVASQFGAMANNITGAAATYQAFNDAARNTNYDFDPVYAMGKQLINMGYSAKNAADLIQLCSDAAAGLGQDVGGCQRLVDTISRIQATGKMTERQLMDLQLAGIDLNAVFAPIGMSGEAAMKALKDGSMDSQEAIGALTDYMHLFDGKMAESKNNLIDLWGDVVGNFSTMCGEIGASIADAFRQSDIVQTLIDFTQSLVDLVRGEGCGVFSLFGDIAGAALNVIGVALEAVVTAVKLVIVIANEMLDAFKEIGSKIYSYLSVILEPLGKIFSIVTQLLAKIGQEIKKGVDEQFKMTFTPKVEVEDVENNFKNPVNTAGLSKSNSSASQKLSEEEKAVEALVKKYADASKLAQERGKLALQAAASNISALTGENRLEQELANKLAGLKLNHDAVIEGYEKELELASKIADSNTRDKTIEEINKQIAAQEELYEAQVKAVNFNALQNKSKDIVAMAFGDTETLQYKLNDYKQRLSTFLQEINALDAGSMQGGQSTLDASGMSQGLSSESMGFMSKLLRATPEELAEEFAEKQDQFATFADFIREKMAEATAAESENLAIGEQWKDKQIQWVTQIGSSIGKALTSWITGAKGIGEAMQDMVKGLLQEAASLLTKWAAVYAAQKVFGVPSDVAAAAANKIVLGIGTTVYGKAAGGFITGPGTATSDSIPAMLSNGEYVIRASAVKNLGVPFLDALNSGVLHRANGGLVGSTSGLSVRRSVLEHMNGGYSSAAADINIAVAQKMGNYERSSDGINAVMNIYGDIHSSSDEQDMWEEFNEMLVGRLAY